MCVRERERERGINDWSSPVEDPQERIFESEYITIFDTIRESIREIM